jgi:HK97 family phage major capsid protein
MYNRAFYSYMRQRGMTQDGRQALGQVRTMVEGTDADGGYLAPTQLVAGIQYIAQDYEALSPSMSVINTTARSLTFTKGDDTVVMGWVAELGTKPEDQLTFSRTVLVPHVGAVVVWVSDELLEDEQFGLQNYISTRVAEAKVLLEEEAFISGSGTGRPWGLLTRLNGLGGTPQRFTTDGASITGNDLINLVYSQPTRYRRNSSFVMGTEAIRNIRLLRDGDTTGQYLWQPGLQAGEPQTILGYPVREVDAAALNSGVATDDDVGIFGDLRQYMVMRRIGLQVKRLEELRALTDEVGFRFRFRVGGDTINNAAFKTIRIGS